MIIPGVIASPVLGAGYDYLPTGNLISYPIDFDNAYWTEDGASASANTTTAPDSTSTADTIIEGSGTGIHSEYRDVLTLSTATDYEMFCYMKMLDWQYSAIGLFWNDTTGIVVQADLSGGSIQYSNAGGSGYSVSNTYCTSMGSGWYKVGCHFQTGDTDNYPGIALSDAAWSSGLIQSAGNEYTGDGSSGTYCWGFGVYLL